jgi:hypothetical protein
LQKHLEQTHVLLVLLKQDAVTGTDVLFSAKSRMFFFSPSSLLPAFACSLARDVKGSSPANKSGIPEMSFIFE